MVLILSARTQVRSKKKTKAIWSGNCTQLINNKLFLGIGTAFNIRILNRWKYICAYQVNI